MDMINAYFNSNLDYITRNTIKSPEILSFLDCLRGMFQK